MAVDPVFLSRLQFAWLIAWHILLPALTVGLASYVALLEGLSLFTGRDIYLRISTFWIKIFSVAFGMGVVSGIIMPFQFGTNWSRFSDATANVIGPLLAYEAIMAFFLEAAFLGVLLFGRKLVPRVGAFFRGAHGRRRHLAVDLLDHRANSWMQTPAGYERRRRPVLCGGLARRHLQPVVSLSASCTRSSPSTSRRHLSSSASAPMLIRGGRFVAEGRVMVGMTLLLLTALVPLQFLLGDQQGLNTLAIQPAKLAAIEARWDTAARRAADPFRHSRRESRAQRRRGRRPLSRQPDPDPFPRRRDQGSEGFSRRPAAAGGDSVLRFPHHGRPRRRDAGRRRAWAVGCACAGGCSTARLSSGFASIAAPLGFFAVARRMDDDRGRAPALDGLWPPAHRRIRSRRR